MAETEPQRAASMAPRHVALLIVLAWAFCFAVRAQYLVVRPELTSGADLPITSADGFLWAEGARDRLAGFHQTGDRSSIDEPVAITTAWILRLAPVSLATVVAWLPALFGSLLVVPLLLIGNSLRLPWAGFFAALIAGASPSYYNRTMAGYFDTDMLYVTLPVLIVWGLLVGVMRKKTSTLVVVSLAVLFCGWWYPESRTLVVATVLGFLLYVVIRDRRSAFNYILFASVLVAQSDVPLYVRAPLLVALVALERFGGGLGLRGGIVSAAAGAGLFAVSGGVAPMLGAITTYLARDTAGQEVASGSLRFLEVMEHIGETRRVGPSKLAARVSGSIPHLLLAASGLVLLARRRREVLLAVPMVAVGILSLVAGARFTVYAVPWFALGLGYLGFALVDRGSSKARAEAALPLKAALGALVLALALYPGLVHAWTYTRNPYPTRVEAETLRRLQTSAQRHDYVLAWWDYGYPLRYYADVKTLVDGRLHMGDVSFPVSFALLEPPPAAARMARLSVEYRERLLKSDPGGERVPGRQMRTMISDYGFADANRFLAALEDDAFRTPPATRDVYFYLPYRMLTIVPSIERFSNLDLTTGKAREESTFVVSRDWRAEAGAVWISDRTRILDPGDRIVTGSREMPVKRHITTVVDRSGNTLSSTRTFTPDAEYSVIHMKSHETYLIVDEKMLRSTFVQLFVLGNEWPRLFEPVILGADAAVYRLKI